MWSAKSINCSLIRFSISPRAVAAFMQATRLSGVTSERCHDEAWIRPLLEVLGFGDHTPRVCQTPPHLIRRE